MPTDANGRVWHAAFAGTVAQNLKPLYTLAEEVGLGEAFIDALQYAPRRLQFDPLAFGELINSAQLGFGFSRTCRPANSFRIRYS